MPKFTFIYRGFFRILNSFRFRSGLDPSVPIPAPTDKTENLVHTKTLSPSLPSRYADSVLRRHPPGHGATTLSGQLETRTHDRAGDVASFPLARYLRQQENLPEDIAKLHRILTLPHLILELGCGNCEVALNIALKNPDWGVIATDKYAWNTSPSKCSHYAKAAQEWRATRQKTHATLPSNLVVVRAEADIMRFFPKQSIDSVLLVNPEPLVGQAFLQFISDALVYETIKPGPRQLVVIPFSREMGVATCGGYEFDHSEDWSKGLGFMMSSEFKFRKANKVQWGVDLSKASPYSRNSTQSDVYLFGKQV